MPHTPIVRPARKPRSLAKDVVIFGVGGPALERLRWTLNLDWSNLNDKYRTRVAVKDAAEALKQVDAYFEQKYRDEHDDEASTVSSAFWLK